MKTADDIRSIAYHEAGHTVIALALNCVVHAVAIAPCCGERRLGELRVSFSKNKFRAATQAAVVPLGGSIAQHRACPGSPRGDDVDLKIPRDAATYLASNARRYFQRSRREAERLIARHWSAVEIIAAALIARRELSGAECSSPVGLTRRLVFPLWPCGRGVGYISA